MNQDKKFDKFLQGYFAAMIFCGLPDEDSPDFDDLSEKLKNETKATCQRFFNKNISLINNACNRIGYGYSVAGMDFFYNRNGHGVGYWDRDLGELGDQLSDLSKKMGEHEIYFGDDGLIYGALSYKDSQDSDINEYDAMSMT